MYDAVGDHFRAIWGPQAGWAQSVLFTANLKAFAGQAASAGTDKGEKEGDGGVVKVEGMVREVVENGGQAGLVSEEGLEVVKAEEQETVVESTVRRTRKRKVTAVARVAGDDDKPVGAVEVEVHARRTSKRLRAAAR
jgi:N-glycosylase/DNA lyase